MINDILGLPFEQPEETYSTSPHLYHDLGIDPAAKGTIGLSRPLTSKRPDKSGTSKSARTRPGTDADPHPYPATAAQWRPCRAEEGRNALT